MFEFNYFPSYWSEMFSFCIVSQIVRLKERQDLLERKAFLLSRYLVEKQRQEIVEKQGESDFGLQESGRQPGESD